MKTLLKLSVFASILVLIALSCKKDVSNESAGINSQTFNAAFAREWYYGVFKKNAEWRNSAEHGKKLPDWKHPTYRKVGNTEIVEFPLNANQTRIPRGRRR